MRAAAAAQPSYAVDRTKLRPSVGRAGALYGLSRAPAPSLLPTRLRPAGFTSSWRSAEHGFTLIELMVALSIFALLAAAGVYLLSGSVRAQGAVQGKLDRLAAVQRAAGLLTVDLAQAVPRISRTENGTLAPAFFAAGGTQADPAVQFVRTGRDNPDGLVRSALQKLEYGVANGQLLRRAYPQVDGAAPGSAAVLLDRVVGASFRFRDADGAWRDAWRPTTPEDMPRAVELTVAQQGAEPIRLLFLVGADPVPTPSPTPFGSPTNG